MKISIIFKHLKFFFKLFISLLWCALFSYRPQTKVIFLHLSVILFTGGKYLGRYTPGPGTPPWDQVHSLPRNRYPSVPGTPPWDQIHPQPGTPPRPGIPLQTRYTPPGAVHAGRYGQQAGGTHPTGMHSCCRCLH